MLEARSVAVVGASARPHSLGSRLLAGLDASPCRPELHLVNPRYDRIGGRPCLPSLDAAPGPVDLVALAVGDAGLDEQMGIAAARGDRAAVIFASAFAPGQRERLAATAAGAGMAVCGPACMGFINPVAGLRAVGYLEPDPIPPGPVALVTHSGSAYSALLRAERRIGWSLAVSSGQELVTGTADYVEYALSSGRTGVLALLLETLRDAPRLRSLLAGAARDGIPAVVLPVGASPGGRAMVEAHSGALAGDDATWEALCEATGAIRVRDMSEMTDTLELLCAGRRPAARADGGPGRLASVHDSGAERALLVDVAGRVGVRLAAIGPSTRERLAAVLDEGLQPGNPLDVWGTGADATAVFTESILALADDPDTAATVLTVDLVPEVERDDSYEDAALAAFARTSSPLAVLSNLPSAIHLPTARSLRAAGVPVLEGTESGLRALGHLLSLEGRRRRLNLEPPPLDAARQARGLAALSAPDGVGTAQGLALLGDYGIAAPATVAVADLAGALAAALAVGYPVVLKTDQPGIAHKSDVGGVGVGIADAGALRHAYQTMSGALGPRAVVMALAPPGVELALGMVRDPLLGPMLVVGAGGVDVEHLSDRRVAMPPVDAAVAAELIDGLAVRPLLDGFRGRPAVDVGAVAEAVAAFATLAHELADGLEAVEVNPLRCGRGGPLALDVLVVARARAGERDAFPLD